MFRQLILALALMWVVMFAWLDRPARAADQEVPPVQAAPSHGAEEEPPNILSADVVLAISTLIVFLLLLVVLGKFAWKPLLKALHEREEHLDHTLQETERARQEAERLLAEHHKQMAQAADQVRALLDEARRDAESTANDIIRKAQAEAEAARHRAEREIGNARDQALVEIWSKAADLAVQVAGRVLPRELSDADHKRLVAMATSELPASPGGSNGHGGHA